MIRTSAIIAPGTFPCDTAILQGPYPEVFRKAAAAGYDCVQLTVKGPEDYDVPELLALMRKYGLGISAMATGRIYSVDGYCMGASGEAARRAAVDRLARLAKDAAALTHTFPDGETIVPAIVIGAVRGRFADAGSPKRFYHQFDRSMRELLERCEALRVPFILEAIEQAESEAFTDPGQTLDYVRSVGSPALHMYLDTMHLYNEGFDPAEAILRFGREAWSIDISGEERRAPMDSVLDFSAICRAIRASGFSGNLTFETKPEPPAESWRESLAFIREKLKESSGEDR